MTPSVIYARIDDAEQQHDLEKQLKVCRRYAQNNGYSIVEEITEVAPGHTGWTERSGLAKVRALGRSGAAHTLLMAHPGVLSTNAKYQDDFIDEFSERGIVIKYVGTDGLPIGIVKLGEQQP